MWIGYNWFRLSSRKLFLNTQLIRLSYKMRNGLTSSATISFWSRNPVHDLRVWAENLKPQQPCCICIVFERYRLHILENRCLEFCVISLGPFLSVLEMKWVMWHSKKRYMLWRLVILAYCKYFSRFNAVYASKWHLSTMHFAGSGRPAT
jgi:hypothetical protein